MMTNLMTILERKAFISSNPRIVLSSCPPPCGHFSIQESASGGLSYKAKKAVNPKTNCFVCMDMKFCKWEFYITFNAISSINEKIQIDKIMITISTFPSDIKH